MQLILPLTHIAAIVLWGLFRLYHITHSVIVPVYASCTMTAEQLTLILRICLSVHNNSFLLLHLPIQRQQTSLWFEEGRWFVAAKGAWVIDRRRTSSRITLISEATGLSLYRSTFQLLDRNAVSYVNSILEQYEVFLPLGRQEFPDRSRNNLPML